MELHNENQWEREAFEAFRPTLGGLWDLAFVTLNFIDSLYERIPEQPLPQVTQAQKSTCVLLSRAFNDLRCVVLLSMYGYPVQATSIAASLMEVAYTIPYIGSNEDLARQWVAHTNPTSGFRKVKDLLMGGLKNLGVPNLENTVRTRQRIYAQLCWAKHSNPLLEKAFGHETEKDSVFVVTGPIVTDQSVRTAYFALEHSIGAALVAVASFIVFQLTPDIGGEFQAGLRELQERLSTFHAQAVKRWGSEDPFPEKW